MNNVDVTRDTIIVQQDILLGSLDLHEYISLLALASLQMIWKQPYILNKAPKQKNSKRSWSNPQYQRKKTYR